jgi:hypothetical protein
MRRSFGCHGVFKRSGTGSLEENASGKRLEPEMLHLPKRADDSRDAPCAQRSWRALHR